MTHGSTNKKKNDQLEQRVADLEAQVIEYDKQLKRAVADYHNLEKRVSEGRSELTSFVGAELIRRLLPVLDHLEQALSGASDTERQSGWFRGVELAVKEFKNVLESEGLEKINAQEETLFNPSLHEAVDTGEGPEGMILKIVRKGYNLNGKVLRPTQVIVGKYSSSEEARVKNEGEQING